MGLFDKLKTVLNEVAQEPAGKLPNEGKTRANVKRQKPNSAKPSAPPAPKSKKAKKAKAPDAKPNPAKELANKRQEPYVEVLSVEIDPNDPGQGSFELDWNDIFLAKLVRAGYQGKTDQDIVDNWFKAVCRNVVMEGWEQEQADPEKREIFNNRRDLGNGRTEIS